MRNPRNIAKLAACKALFNSPNPHEAAAARLAYNRLIAKYGAAEPAAGIDPAASHTNRDDTSPGDPASNMDWEDAERIFEARWGNRAAAAAKQKAKEDQYKFSEQDIDKRMAELNAEHLSMMAEFGLL